MPKLIAKTKQLILRPYEKSDYLAWRNERLGRGPKKNKFDRDPVTENLLTRKQFSGALRTLEQAQKKDLLYSFGIFHRKTGECMGRITLGIICRRGSLERLPLVFRPAPRFKTKTLLTSLEFF